MGTLAEEIYEADELKKAPHPAFSICTLVTNPPQYEEMVASFRAAGFGEDCEFLFIDNSTHNKFDGYSGLNFFLSHSSGSHIIICHQDVLLAFDDRRVLEARLSELTELDPYWAVCGNAGLTEDGSNAIRITDPHAADTKCGAFPSRVVGLDENFIVTRNCWNLSVSPRLTGFHLYATELCNIAHLLGLNTYVIDFHLRHLSGGSMQGFGEAMMKLATLQSFRLRPHVIGNTCGVTVVARSARVRKAGNLLLNTRLKALVHRAAALYRSGYTSGS
jgi:hypothetical protein